MGSFASWHILLIFLVEVAGFRNIQPKQQAKQSVAETNAHLNL